MSELIRMTHPKLDGAVIYKSEHQLARWLLAGWAVADNEITSKVTKIASKLNPQVADLTKPAGPAPTSPADGVAVPTAEVTPAPAAVKE